MFNSISQFACLNGFGSKRRHFPFHLLAPCLAAGCCRGALPGGFSGLRKRLGSTLDLGDIIPLHPRYLLAWLDPRTGILRFAHTHR